MDEKFEMIKQLGDRLHELIQFVEKAITESNRPDLELKWYSSVSSGLTYSLILIRCFLNNKDLHYKTKEEDYIIGKLAITSFLEIVNRFEQSILEMLIERDSVKKKIYSQISEKQKRIKVERLHFSTIRESLYKNNFTNKLDNEILEFAWKIRNCIHRNFVTDKDINFEYPDIRTGNKYIYQFKKGDELYHPSDLLSFFVITEQLVFIMICILQRTEKELK